MSQIDSMREISETPTANKQMETAQETVNRSSGENIRNTDNTINTVPGRIIQTESTDTVQKNPEYTTGSENININPVDTGNNTSFEGAEENTSSSAAFSGKMGVNSENSQALKDGSTVNYTEEININQDNQAGSSASRITVSTEKPEPHVITDPGGNTSLNNETLKNLTSETSVVQNERMSGTAEFDRLASTTAGVSSGIKTSGNKNVTSNIESGSGNEEANTGFEKPVINNSNSPDYKEFQGSVRNNTSIGEGVSTFSAELNTAATSGVEETKQGMENKQQTEAGITASMGKTAVSSSSPLKNIFQTSAFNGTDSEQIINQVVTGARLMVHNGKTRMVLVLNPPELGRLRIELATEGSKLFAKLAVESAEIKQLLEANTGHLREILHREGIKIEQFDVRVGVDDSLSNGTFQQMNSSHANAHKPDEEWMQFAPDLHSESSEAEEQPERLRPHMENQYVDIVA